VDGVTDHHGKLWKQKKREPQGVSRPLADEKKAEWSGKKKKSRYVHRYRQASRLKHLKYVVKEKEVGSKIWGRGLFIRIAGWAEKKTAKNQKKGGIRAY